MNLSHAHNLAPPYVHPLLPRACLCLLLLLLLLLAMNPRSLQACLAADAELQASASAALVSISNRMIVAGDAGERVALGRQQVRALRRVARRGRAGTRFRTP